MPTPRDCDEVNRNLWDIWTPLHAKTEFYDVDGFRRGKNTLKAIEREALGDVAGKRILHLQCHFGLDTLSLARMGAEVTGVDYSGESIRYARALSEEAAIPARFLEQSLYDLDSTITEPFDIVFSSHGILHWLHDLQRWGEVIHYCLSDDGFFYLVEFHPLFNMLSEDGSRFVFPYFASEGPVKTKKKGLCMDANVDFEHDAYEWPHSLSEIMMALLQPGLKIDDFAEYPFILFDCLPNLTEIAPGRFAPRDREVSVPMMFALRASRQRA